MYTPIPCADPLVSPFTCDVADQPNRLAIAPARNAFDLSVFELQPQLHASPTIHEDLLTRDISRFVGGQVDHEV